MKIIFFIGYCFLCIAVQGQNYIKPRNLQVTDNRTTNIIFPAEISSIDRGSERIVVQKSTGNILRVKADTLFTDTTNLTVITSDGKLYSFLVSYAASPVFLNIDLGVNESVIRDTALYALSEKILKTANNLGGIRYSSGMVRLSLAGIYTTGEIIGCKLRIENTSSLSFETGRLRCYVIGSRGSKRRPSQQTEIIPLLVNPVSVIAKEKQAIVMVLFLPKAALRTGQALQIDLSEKNGERQLSLHINNRFILRSTLIQ
ncbi:MAG: DUF4138 domain-containing protein [Bacteroidota bacterium]